MCGIVGFTGADDGSRLEVMCRLQTHRGPDEEGYYRDANVSLGMRRRIVEPQAPRPQAPAAPVA